MRILVTGATGLIGCHAVAALGVAGHTVRVLVRDPGKLDRVLAPFGLDAADVEIVRGDLGDPSAIARGLEGCAGLLHAAGRFSPDRRDQALLAETNVEGTRAVFAEARKVALDRAVHVSSILALFPPQGAVMSAADDVTRPSEMYAATKAAAERVARSAQADLPLTIVYPAAVQGPHDPTFSVGPQLVADALRVGRVLVTEGGLPTTDARDLARLFVAIFGGGTSADRLMGPAFFVPHGRYHALLESITGRRLRTRHVPGRLLRAMGRLGDLADRLGFDGQLTSEAAAVLTRSVPVDDREARRLLEGACTTDEASFRDLVRWMVEVGHLDGEHAGRASPN